MSNNTKMIMGVSIVLGVASDKLAWSRPADQYPAQKHAVHNAANLNEQLVCKVELPKLM